MRKMIFSFLVVLLMGLGFLNLACYAHVNGAGVGVDIAPHDQRWHYDHDPGHDDAWRSQHAWHDDRKDWDH